ncbi:CWC16 protein [Amylocystis lapponica]|nr:CWC16 protein [Amylocystis lapponica]
MLSEIAEELCNAAVSARRSTSDFRHTAMQGFNKYYPPDYDGEKHGSLNAYRGKHALGDRARKIDQGILITRFELPFNIWCGTCNNHIGMGVRYNAEKKKIGNYFSTPIFSFRCKCHLCDGWFEIQTDPQNTRYVVTSGARQKDEDWDPEENGGFAIHNTDPNEGPVDPLAALEKSTAAQNYMNQVQVPRVEALQTLSDHYNADPYSLSVKVRKKFRQEKKIDKEKQRLDESLRDRYGLPEALALAAESEESRAEAKEQWLIEKQMLQSQKSAEKKMLFPETGILPRASSSRPTVQKLSSDRSSRLGGKTSTSAVLSLRTRILENTAKQTRAMASVSKPSTSSLFRR